MLNKKFICPLRIGINLFLMQSKYFLLIFATISNNFYPKNRYNTYLYLVAQRLLLRCCQYDLDYALGDAGLLGGILLCYCGNFGKALRIITQRVKPRLQLDPLRHRCSNAQRY